MTLAATVRPKKSYLVRKPERRTNWVASVLLFVLLLVICVGPRIRVGGLGELDIDLRTQDLLLVPAMLYLLLSQKPHVRTPLIQLYGWLLPAFVWCAVMVTLLMTAFAPEVSTLRRVAFLGRNIELFVLASAIAGLYLRAGRRALPTAVNALKLSVLANVAWVLVQAATGTRQTLLGGETGNLIESYGPKLVGEASAFGAGQFFVFATAVGAALYKSGYGGRVIAFLFMGAGVAGAGLVESRISLGISAFIVAAQFVRTRKRRLNPFGITIGVLLAIIAALTVLPSLMTDRLSAEKVEGALGVRVTDIWEPLLPYVLNNPLLGIGPGGLTPDLPRSEAHNIILRAGLDFGLIGGALFLALFIVAARKASQVANEADLEPQSHVFALLCKYGVYGVLVSGLVQDALTGVTSSHLAMLCIGLFAAANARLSPNPETPAGRIPLVQSARKAHPPRVGTKQRRPAGSVSDSPRGRGAGGTALIRPVRR